MWFLIREFPSDVCPTLSVLVVWLLRQCGRPQTECRHQCMMLIYKLTSLLPGRPAVLLYCMVPIPRFLYTATYM